jgi:imidazolonepropionase-like amidohydrolase
MAMRRPYHLRGVLVETGQETDLWVADGRISSEAIPGAETLVDHGWILPGLVDAHCHVGLSPAGAVDPATAERQARTDLATGVTLIRDAGAPTDTHWLDGRAGLPRLIRAGRHIARPQRYLRGFAVEVEPEDLVAETARQAQAGDGWVKLVGDWIDRQLGDLAPLWPDQVLGEAVRVAHQGGARVTGHCFGEESVHQMVSAGVDCIEHGCGLDQATIAAMARHGVALVPTLDNLEIFPGIADQAEPKFPVYAAHMRHLYARRDHVVAQAVAAGVAVYAGTDAGGTRAHGTILAEVRALARVAGPDIALGATAWRARAWLGAAGLAPGAPADLVVARRDPRQSVEALGDLALVMVAGQPVSR